MPWTLYDVGFELGEGDIKDRASESESEIVIVAK